MGNHCNKSNKKKKYQNKEDSSNEKLGFQGKNTINEQKMKDETKRINISLNLENDPQMIFLKLSSNDLTEVLTNDISFNLDNYLSKLNDLDIDLLVSVIKMMDGLDLLKEMPKENSKQLEISYLKAKECFVEFKLKYLSLQPKDSRNFAMKFLKIYIESYHLLKIHQKEHEEKNFYKFLNANSKEYSNDFEYIKDKFSEIESETIGHFKGVPKAIIERNVDKYRNVTQIFITEIFDFAIHKISEENFVESWSLDNGEKFGKESDHKALKCFDYKFEIHMMTHI